MLKRIGNFKIPEWWDCGWKRVSCNKKSCLLCGRILRDRRKHIERGEDPDSMKSAMEDAGGSLSEALRMIKKDAERLGIDITNLENIKEPPEPEKFSLYRKVAKWRNFVSEIVKHAEESDNLWLGTEAAADLLWYKNTLAAKTYRQLCNLWHMDNGDEYGDIDFKYTKYVLIECLKILKRSLNALALLASDQKGELMMAAGQMAKLESAILTVVK